MNLGKVNNPKRIFVIGYMGSNTEGTAHELAERYNFKYVNLDDAIKEKDGRSVLRICMSFGEHEYRNKEYELLQELSEQDEIVVACGDGVVLDEMNLATLINNPVVYVDEDIDILWQRVRTEKSFPYAYLQGYDEKLKYEKFCSFYETRRSLYLKCIE